MSKQRIKILWNNLLKVSRLNLLVI